LWVSATLGFGAISVGLGLVAVSMAYIAEILIQGIRSQEVEEKIAMMKAYMGDNGARIVSDLEALAAVSNGATESQASKIQERGKVLLEWMSEHYPNSVEGARGVLNGILKPFGKSV